MTVSDPLDVVVQVRLDRRGLREKNFKLPQTTSAHTLKQIARQFELNVTRHDDAAYHLVGIANAGLPLAVEVAMWIGLSDPAKEVLVTRLDPRLAENIVDTERVSRLEQYRTIILDSSIKSGSTAAWAINLLRSKNCPVDLIVKLFGYNDAAERDVNAKLENQYGVSVVSLFPIDQLNVIGQTCPEAATD